MSPSLPRIFSGASSVASLLGRALPGTPGEVATVASSLFGFASEIAGAGIDPAAHITRIRSQRDAVQRALDAADAEQARLAAGGRP